jgi:hypothetical protein
MTTFRLLRQTNRSARFAQVTVEVEPSSGFEVEVTAAVAVEYQREADLGARWALRGLAESVKVTVTDVIVSPVDTSEGDVYEATAHCVWQALGVEYSKPYVGFSDPGLVASWLNAMVGRRLDAVTEARHWFKRRRGPDAESLIHAWLHFEQAVPVEIAGRGDELLLSKEEPYLSYDMEEYGETRVGPASPPDVLAKFVGATLIDGAVITGPSGDCFSAGLLLQFEDGDLTIGTHADEWVLTVGSAPEAVAPSWRMGPLVRGVHR